LVAFGFDSLIELVSAGVLIWRLSTELKFGREFSERAEAVAGRIADGLLFALAAYVVAAAGWSLWRGEGEAFSWRGVIALLAIPIMLALAKCKRVLATRGKPPRTPIFRLQGARTRARGGGFPRFRGYSLGFRPRFGASVCFILPASGHFLGLSALKTMAILALV